MNPTILLLTLIIQMSDSLYSISAMSIDGQEVSLGAYRGKVLIIVNTASECGFTPHYTGLEKLYRAFKDSGLVVLGFPCNQFGSQEPGDEAQIKEFCRKEYDVTFPLFAKIDVNGDSAHPLYKLLKAAAPGIFDTAAIKWNFTKFLVGRDGAVLKRFAPNTAPEEMADEIEATLLK